jgi:hypothetical protein
MSTVVRPPDAGAKPRSAARRRGAPLAAIALAGLAQCGPRLVRPDASDAAPPPTDTLVIVAERPRPDTDGDGLCDDTEIEVLRSDPEDVDTDGDGFLDGFEYSQGTSPLSVTAPDPARVLTWSEAPSAHVESVFNVYFRGNGEGVFGAFYESPSGVDGVRGEDLGFVIEALAALPPSNAQDRVGERFLSVLGQTRLSFRLSADWGEREPAGCRRAYVLYPSAYAEGSGLIYLRGLYLDVRPSTEPASMDAGVTSDDAAARDSGPPDAGVDGGIDGGRRGPWPHRRDGFCLPRPGSCR